MSRLYRNCALSLCLVAVMTLAVVATACQKEASKTSTAATGVASSVASPRTSLVTDAAVTELSSQQAYSLVLKDGGNPDFVVLDVRTPAEFGDGHIKSAINVDVQSPGFRADIGKMSASKTYLVYCRSGNRSRQAVVIMRELGFSHIYHLTKGLTEWSSENLPLVK
jgi:rhodanese-related sulfurtransferase